jgi:hypothetical protein
MYNKQLNILIVTIERVNRLYISEKTLSYFFLSSTVFIMTPKVINEKNKLNITKQILFILLP